MRSRSRRSTCNWPRHDDISLRITAKRENVFADFSESELSVEGDRSRVVLPYAKPDDVCPTGSHLIEAREHEFSRNAHPVRVVQAAA